MPAVCLKGRKSIGLTFRKGMLLDSGGLGAQMYASGVRAHRGALALLGSGADEEHD